MSRQSNTGSSVTQTITMDTSEMHPMDQVFRRIFQMPTIGSSFEQEWTSIIDAVTRKDTDSLRNSLCVLLFSRIDSHQSSSLTSSASSSSTETPTNRVLAELSGSRSEEIFNLIVDVYSRCLDELANPFLTDELKTLANETQACCVLAICMLLDGAFSDEKNKPYIGSIVLRSIVSESLPGVLMEQFLECAFAENQSNALHAVFDSLGRSVRNASILASTNEYIQAIEAFVRILQHRAPNTKPPLRPACNILVDRDDFNPTTSSTGLKAVTGRGVLNLSYLGQIFKLSLGDGMSRDLDKYFSSYDVSAVPRETLEIVFRNLQGRIAQIRTSSQKIVKELLANAQSREKTLAYLENIITTNWKRAQMQVNPAEVADDGTMLNILSILYELSAPITLDKVETTYIYHKQARVRSAFHEETRMRLTPNELEEYEKQFEGADAPSKFTTECFFLTVNAQHIGIVSMLHKSKGLSQQIYHLMKEIKKAEVALANEVYKERKSKIQAALGKLKSRRDRIVRAVWSQQCQLNDQGLLHQALQFSLKQLNLIVRAIEPQYGSTSASLPEDAPMEAKALPEFYLEDVLDLLLHLVRSAPELLVSLPSVTDCLQAVLVFVTNSQYFTNVFLAAKSVELLYYFCPSRQPAARNIWEITINHQLAVDRLFPSLLKFYCRVESTGSHNDFYEKFDTRHHINTIFMHLREVPIHRTRMIFEADKCDEAFIQFVNMIINDTTFMLDESLDGLIQINKIENTDDAQLTTEEREQQQGQLDEQARRARGWLSSVGNTLDTFVHLSKDCPRPFLEPNLGERLAVMLNYNLQRLCGQSCQQLKVANPQSYGWKPKELVERLVDIYLNLSTEEFASYIAKDERSYNKETMDVILARMEKHALVPLPQMERLSDLFQQANVYFKENLQEDEQFDDPPDEFLDPIMGTLMRDPVRLPSNHVVERQVIERCLLSDPIDPFNRAPLTKDQLETAHDVKQRIEAWKQEKRQQK